MENIIKGLRRGLGNAFIILAASYHGQCVTQSCQPACPSLGMAAKNPEISSAARVQLKIHVTNLLMFYCIIYYLEHLTWYLYMPTFQTRLNHRTEHTHTQMIQAFKVGLVNLSLQSLQLYEKSVAVQTYKASSTCRITVLCNCWRTTCCLLEPPADFTSKISFVFTYVVELLFLKQLFTFYMEVH